VRPWGLESKSRECGLGPRVTQCLCARPASIRRGSRLTAVRSQASDSHAAEPLAAPAIAGRDAPCRACQHGSGDDDAVRRVPAGPVGSAPSRRADRAASSARPERLLRRSLLRLLRRMRRVGAARGRRLSSSPRRLQSCLCQSWPAARRRILLVPPPSADRPSELTAFPVRRFPRSQPRASSGSPGRSVRRIPCFAGDLR
jgi:hypothetical protein